MRLPREGGGRSRRGHAWQLHLRGANGDAAALQRRGSPSTGARRVTRDGGRAGSRPCVLPKSARRHRASERPRAGPIEAPMSAPMSLSADDAVYATAMLMFATLPILSMRKPRPPDASASPEPARLVAAGAFVLLLWLQVRKQYLLGVSMVAINLVLRLYEIQRHTCHVTSRAVVVPQAAPCVRGAPTSFLCSCLRCAGQLSPQLVHAQHARLGRSHHATVVPQATTTSLRSSGGGRHSRGRPGGRAAGRPSRSSASSASPAPAPWPSRAPSSGEPWRSGVVCKASRRSC